MRIVIKERLKPFSHRAGSSCLIPGTSLVIQAYPTLLKIAGKEISLSVLGPVLGFTLELDLEKDCTYVYGQAKNGYYKIRIFASEEGVHIVPQRGVALEAPLLIPGKLLVKKVRMERLFLGSHKAQNWDRVDLKTALPVLYALGQKTPSGKAEGGAVALLEMPKERLLLLDALQNFFKGAFTKMLVPRLVDEDYQGVFVPTQAKGDPCYLLTEGAQQIRSLFLEQKENVISILPRLPVPFDCGKIADMQVPGMGEIDFEWSKKKLQALYLRADSSGEVLFDFPKEIRKFRVIKAEVVESDRPFSFEKGRTYFFDRFQK